MNSFGPSEELNTVLGIPPKQNVRAFFLDWEPAAASAPVGLRDCECGHPLMEHVQMGTLPCKHYPCTCERFAAAEGSQQ